MVASLLYPAQCFLGEGPFWHPQRGSLFWVDIEGKTFYEYHWADQQVTVRRLDYRVTLLVQGQDNQLILGLEGGIGRYDLVNETFTWLADLEKDRASHRCNDGKVDSRGRLWLGTMHMDFHTGAGSLYSVEQDLLPRKKQGGLTISNGMAWSADNSRLYFIDSPTGRVQSFFYDEAGGGIAFEKDVILIPPHLGAPDGMAIDQEGMLWIAHWGGFGVYRWNPNNGQLMESVSLPVPNVTSCVFGGESLDYLMITTARQGLSPEDLQKYPHSGDVFVQQVAVKGTLPNRCVF